MKEKDIKTEARKQTFVMYAEKDDGTYGTVESGSYLIENDLDDFWVKMEHIERSMREKLIKGEISPIHYFMVIEGLTPLELASRAGVSPGRVKKHMTMKGFEQMSVRELHMYANVFNVPLANIFQVIVSSKGMNIKYHFYNKEENAGEKNTILQEQTLNPCVVVTKVEELKK